jgi:hypothetical protein
MMHGTARLTNGPTGRSGSQNRVLRSWREADLPQLLRVVPRKISGRRIASSTAHRWPYAGSSAT